MYDFAGDHPLDLNELRARLGWISDAALQQFGAAARYMRSAKANAEKPPREVFVVQLVEAISEWRRRHLRGVPAVQLRR